MHPALFGAVWVTGVSSTTGEGRTLGSQKPIHPISSKKRSGCTCHIIMCTPDRGARVISSCALCFDGMYGMNGFLASPPPTQSPTFPPIVDSIAKRQWSRTRTSEKRKSPSCRSTVRWSASSCRPKTRIVPHLPQDANACQPRFLNNRYGV